MNKTTIYNQTYNDLLSWIAQVAFCFTLLFITGLMHVPFKPVPFIVYDLSVLFICINFSARISFPAVFSYLSLRILQTSFPLLTGGYMIGILVNSLIIDWCKNYINNKKVLYIMGTVMIFIFGLPWLAYSIGFSAALKNGLLPFIIPSLIKFSLFVIIQQFIYKRK